MAKHGQQPKKYLNSLINSAIHDDLSRAAMEFGISKTALINRWMAYILTNQERMERATKHRQNTYDIN